MSTTETFGLVEELGIAAPPERVFRALTDPDAITRWWRVPGAYETTAARLDLRPGAAYRFSGTSAARGSFDVRGEFRDVEPPMRLSYTWNPDWDDDAAGSLVSFRLAPSEGGTRLVMEHTGIASASARDRYQPGWRAVLASLRDLIQG